MFACGYIQQHQFRFKIAGHLNQHKISEIQFIQLAKHLFLVGSRTITEKVAQKHFLFLKRQPVYFIFRNNSTFHAQNQVHHHHHNHTYIRIRRYDQTNRNFYLTRTNIMSSFFIVYVISCDKKRNVQGRIYLGNYKWAINPRFTFFDKSSKCF